MTDLYENLTTRERNVIALALKHLSLSIDNRASQVRKCVETEENGMTRVVLLTKATTLQDVSDIFDSLSEELYKA